MALQINHRVSADFDFFSETKIAQGLFRQIEKKFKTEPITVQVNNPEELTLTIGGVKLTFLYYPFPALGKFAYYQKLKLLNIPEIGAAKAYALGRRATYRDYIDLYFILSEKHTGLAELMALSKKKYQRHFDPRLFLEQLIYLEDVEDLEVRFLKQPVTKQEVERFFQKEVRKIEL